MNEDKAPCPYCGEPLSMSVIRDRYAFEVNDVPAVCPYCYRNIRASIEAKPILFVKTEEDYLETLSEQLESAAESLNEYDLKIVAKELSISSARIRENELKK